MTRPSIAIVAHNAYGPMAGSTSGHIGGVEWQTSLTARWLAREGYPVSLVTWADGSADDETIDGVRVLKVCRRDAGLRGLRFLHPRWTGLVSALGRAGADVYYHNGAEEVTGQVGLWCRLKGRAFVFSSACDTDCERALPSLDTRSRILYRRGLRDAHARIVQTDTQARLMRESFGLDSVVIPMPCPGPTDAEFVARTEAASRRVLWIARVTRQKRPDRLLDVARLCPDLAFDLVGPSDGTDYARGVLEAAATVTNVTVHGPVPREQARGFFRDAALLLSTSDFEGFPNTFLEAWSVGMPIASTFDPDTVIARHDLGFVASEPAELARSVRALVDSRETWAQKSAQARRYYRQNHAAEAVLPRFETVFRDVARGTRA